MKKYFNKILKHVNIIALFILTGFVMISSCKKYLDIIPVSSNAEGSVFSSIKNVQSVVDGVYSAALGDAAYGIRLSIYYPYDSDEMTMNTGPGGDGRGDLAHYGLTAGNTELVAPYSALYKGIQNANLAIKFIPQMPMYTNGLDEQKKKLRSLLGESLTLRALYFLELTKIWGDVPASFVPSEDLKGDVVPNTDRFATYDSLLIHLKIAEDLVPWRSEVGGISNKIYKGFVKGLRARIALYRGGWAENMYTGVMERKPDYKDYYKIALDETHEIINKTGEYELSQNYESIFKDGICAHKYVNNEVLFEAEMVMNGGGTSDSKLGYANGPQSIGGVGNGYPRPLPTYFYMFDSADTRRDVTIVLYKTGEIGATVKNIAPVTAITGMYDGKFRRDWITNPIAISGQYPAGINWPFMRYSDVLLMYAEAYNEYYGSPSAGELPTAITVFEQVRQRAFGTAAIGVTPTDKIGFFTFLVKERALEFGDEGIRKYDLLRWNLLDTKIAEVNATLTAISIAIRDGVDMPAPYTNLTKTMYAKAQNGKLIYYNSFFQPTPSSTDVANATNLGYIKITWLSGIFSSASSDIAKRATLYMNFARDFNPAKSHLFPYPTNALSTNSKLKQNFGY